MTTRTVARNVVWNWAGMGVAILAGLVTVPYLVHHLGDTRYGLWILVASFTSYFGLLDMGVRGAVGRQMAFHEARGDQEGMKSTLSTSLAILSGAGVLSLLAIGCIIPFFCPAFQVPAEHVHTAQVSLALVALNLLFWLPFTTFDAVLWAYQRFDLINAVEITAAVVRVALIFGMIGHGYGLVAMGVINLITMAGNQAVKGMLVFWLDPSLRPGVRHVTRETARALMRIGFWNFLISMSAVLSAQIPVLLIGKHLHVDRVPPYSIAQRLMAYGHDFLVASTGVLTPVAVSMHAGREDQRQRALFIEGGKYCLALAVFFVAVLVILGKSIITVWVGAKYAYVYKLLLIMALGEALPAGQWVAFSIILGKYKHKTLGLLGLVENLLALVLALVLVRPLGLVGLCLAFAIPAALCRGVIQFIYASRLVQVRIREYMTDAVAPVLMATVLPVAGLAAAVRYRTPGGFVEMVMYLAAFGMAYAGCCLGLIWHRQVKTTGVESVRGLARRVATVLAR